MYLSPTGGVAVWLIKRKQSKLQSLFALNREPSPPFILRGGGSATSKATPLF